MGDTKPAEPASGKSAVKLDPKTFTRRLQSLYEHWQSAKEDDNLWKGADAIVIALGQPDDENPYKKTNAMQNWFLGYEFPDTIMIFCEKELHILSSAKKVQMLEPLQKSMQDEGNTVALHFLTTNRADNNKSNHQIILDAIRKSKSGKNVGVLQREKLLGDFGKSWEGALNASGLTQVDITLGFSELLSIKDQQELKNIRTAAEITVKVMNSNMIHNMETVIDEGKQVTHAAFGDQIDEVFNNPGDINPKFAEELVESCYIPIIQSGGKYDLRLSASNIDEPLHFGTIVCALGARYRAYCSNVARTFFIDPKKEQEQNYKLLLEVYHVVIKSLKPGVKMSAVMEKALKYIDSKNPSLVKHFLKSCGYGIGIEFQEPYLALNTKNNRVISAGMVFNVIVGFQNLELSEMPKDPKNKVYSMLLSDTVIVKESGDPEILTKDVDKGFGNVSYFIEEEHPKEKPIKTEKPKDAPIKKERIEVSSESESDDASKPKSKPKHAPITFADGPRSRDNKAKSKKDEGKIQKHQKELAEQLVKQRMEQEFTKGAPSPVASSSNDVAAYSDPSAFPNEASKSKIVVDVRNESVLLPIYGFIVPFHITTIKNASKTDEYLRINFVTPTIAAAQTQSGDKNIIYLREVTYRIQDPRSLNNSLRLIKELRKRVTEREAELKEKRSLITQDKLIISKNRNPRLTDLFIRPNISGRRTPGILEAHVNGFRFTTNKNVTIDILYKNIKHAFFQPADKEMIILIHFHLHNAIMIGKKKTNDVQFYSEVMEGSMHLDSASRSYDRDEIEDEQREAELRNKLNKDFQAFCKRVEEAAAASGTDMEFDIPYRELGFWGVPSKSNVFMQPTVHCLVSLVEMPFFVLTLNEVEICHFERVQFSLRNFDLVFVFKDFSRPVCRINNIPVESLETIKEWLDSCNIKFYEGPTNLYWPRIMSTIREDEKKFFEEGGWAFLEAGSSDEEQDDDPEDQESDFEPEGSADEEDDEVEEEASDDDYESEASDEEEDSSGYDDEDEEGESWDELERKAREADRARGHFDDESPKKRKRGGEYSSDSEDEKRKPKKQAKQQPTKSNGKAPAKGTAKGKK